MSEIHNRHTYMFVYYCCIACLKIIDNVNKHNKQISCNNFRKNTNKYEIW